MPHDFIKRQARDLFSIIIFFYFVMEITSVLGVRIANPIL